MNATFCLSSNIVPQTHASNIGTWFQLERLSRLLINYYQEVYVISGPLWLSQEQFKNRILSIDLVKKNESPNVKKFVLDENSKKENGNYINPHSKNDESYIDNFERLKDFKNREDLKNQEDFNNSDTQDSVNKPNEVGRLSKNKKRFFEILTNWWGQIFIRFMDDEKRKKIENDKIESVVIGDRCVHVPTHLFKIIFCIRPIIDENERYQNDENKVVDTDTLKRRNKPFVLFQAFVVPNDSKTIGISILDCQRSIRFIEFYSGLNFEGLMDYASDESLNEIARFAQQGIVTDIGRLMLGDGIELADFIAQLKPLDREGNIRNSY